MLARFRRIIRAVGKAFAHEEDFVKSGGEALLEFWGENRCWERVVTKLE
jgi:hypothetical protein